MDAAGWIMDACEKDRQCRCFRRGTKACFSVQFCGHDLMRNILLLGECMLSFSLILKNGCISRYWTTGASPEIPFDNGNMKGF